ncbi:hypothetical protein D3C75_1168440 [compost metagenome]
MHRHLAQGTHHHKYRRSTHQIGKQHGRASQLNSASGTIKQTGTDGRTQGHKADMSRVQATPELGFLITHVASPF